MTGVRDSSGPVILAVATVLGVWLGLTAPSTSPVTPVPIAPDQAVAAAQAQLP